MKLIDLRVVIDAVIFITLIFFAYQSYELNSRTFDALRFSAMIYIAIRKPDINTITLISIIAIGDFIPLTTIYFVTVNGYILHSMLFIINLIMLFTVWARSLIILKHAPKLCRGKGVTGNTQDSVIGLLFSFQAIWQLAQLIEHVARNREDIGLADLFHGWVPMFFYNMYKTGQFGFYILMLMILYFMTFDRSKQSK